jgi:uncharacterized protein (DUF1800 family)
MPIVSSKGIAAYTGSFSDKEKIHLLKRCLFGMKRSDLALLNNLDLSSSIDLLIQNNIVGPPVNNYQNRVADTNVPYGSTWVTAPSNAAVNSERTLSFVARLMGNYINQASTLEEKMTLFLHNCFPVEVDTVNDGRLVYMNYNLLRTNCFGNLKALVTLISKDLAMLRYLNGEKNQKLAPDENFARELQELFTVGKALNPHYSEDDVKTAAKVLTGYQIDDVNLKYVFNSTRHDSSNKTFSSFYNSTSITGKSGAAGESELDDLVNMIFSIDEVAKYFCRKLYTFFVYYEIDATVESNVIVPLAQLLISSNWEIKPVLKALLMSEHFFDTDTFGSMIKSPVDHFIGALRECEVVLPNGTNHEQNYLIWLNIYNFIAAIGQAVYNPPNVAGWQAYYQLPLYHENWINTDTIGKRNKYTAALLVGYAVGGYTI